MAFTTFGLSILGRPVCDHVRRSLMWGMGIKVLDFVSAGNTWLGMAKEAVCQQLAPV